MQAKSKATKQQASRGKTFARLDDVKLHELVCRRAYELYERRGRVEGHDCEDWLEAEREILAAAEAGGSVGTSAPISRNHAGA